MLALLLALALGAMPAPGVHAATITVNTTADNLTAGDGWCTLREAIMNANADADTTSGDCTAGSGADTINIPAGTYTIALTGNTDSNNLTGDLDIKSDLTLQGAGQATTIIDGDGSVIGDRVLKITGAYNVTVADLTIRNGRAAGSNPTGSGGGIYAGASAGTVTIRRCRITNNSTGVCNCSGGGVYVLGGMDLIVDASTISDNWANKGGGGIRVYAYQSDLTLTESTVKDNTASWGGGLDITSGTADIRNSTVSSNRAVGTSGGGGIGLAVTHSSITIAHATIVDNTSGGSGGGIGNQYAAGSATIRNTILANNTISAGSGPDCSAWLTSDNYNLVEDTTGCTFTPDATDITGSDPALDPLDDYGGDTETHRLQDGSPALNVIPSGTNGCGTTYNTDQRGVSRPQGTSCDIGAYEKDQANYVELLSFIAQAEGRAVTVAWQTAVEVDNAGFNLYRAWALDGARTQLNAQLIASQAAFGAGASYSFRDRPGTGTFYYWLEAVGYDGARTLHGPVQVQTGRPGLLVPAPPLAPDS
jgi:CSLREA domain-containing protein